MGLEVLLVFLTQNIGGFAMEDSMLINDIIKTIKKYIWVILLFTILGGVVGRVFSADAPAPTYETFSLLFLDQKQEETNGFINKSDESTRFFNTAQTLISTPVILNPVLENLNLDMTTEELGSKVTVTIENNSKIIKIAVVDSDPEQAVKIANEIGNVFTMEIPQYLDVKTVKIIDEAKLGEEKVTIHARPKANMAMGVIIGLVLGTLLSFALNFFFNRSRTSK